ncbi:MAG: hypothetical protein M3539_03670 [Acidobacteriota bacterium]|nr:hypothetical protein [Acidobacteriota bacterium]
MSAQTHGLIDSGTSMNGPEGLNTHAYCLACREHALQLALAEDRDPRDVAIREALYSATPAASMTC